MPYKKFEGFHNDATVRQAAKTIDRKQSIINLIAQNGSANSADIAAHIDLSQARTRVLLSESSDDGKIKPHGNGRSRRYVLPNAES